MSGERTFFHLEDVRLEPRPWHLAIGMFDGVHRGHQAVVESALMAARRRDGLAGVLTFWPHPSRLFRPQDPTPQIMSAETKRAFLFQLGADFVVQQPFDAGFAAVTASEFVPLLKRCLPHLECLYVGENWRFGRGREGDIHFLITAAAQAGLNVISVERVNLNGQPISSTRIRDLLTAGDIAAANQLLGYSYFAHGKVESGRRLGRQLGFPTLNVAWEPELKPAYGVYAVTVAARGVTDGPWISGVANYGLRPTVGDAVHPRLEIHLLEPCPFGEGDELQAEWLTFLRPEQRFASLDDLRRQIGLDRDRAAAYFAGEKSRARADS